MVFTCFDFHLVTFGYYPSLIIHILLVLYTLKLVGISLFISPLKIYPAHLSTISPTITHYVYPKLRFASSPCLIIRTVNSHKTETQRTYAHETQLHITICPRVYQEPEPPNVARFKRISYKTLSDEQKAGFWINPFSLLYSTLVEMYRD